MTKFDENIDLNLKIIYNGNNHCVFISELKNVEGDFLDDFDGKRMADKLADKGLITRTDELCEITKRGLEVIETGGWEEYKKIEEEAKKSEIEERKQRSDLESENLRLQNENLKYEKSIRKSNEKIDRLTVKNLELQNTHLKYYFLFSVIGFILGAVVSNLEFVIGWFD